MKIKKNIRAIGLIAFMVAICGAIAFYIIKKPDRQRAVLTSTQKKISEENAAKNAEQKAKDEAPMQDRNATENITQAGLSQEDLDSYYALYNTLEVKCIRTALDNYLSQNPVGLSESAVTKAVHDTTGDEMGLDSFSHNYYKSKFIVLLAQNQDKAGGSLFNIIFVDKPDKVFQAWIYPVESGGVVLRGFLHLKKYDDAAIADIRIQYKRFFEDTAHMM